MFENKGIRVFDENLGDCLEGFFENRSLVDLIILEFKIFRS